MSANPTNLAALPAKQTADNGGAFAGLLQPVHRSALLADATDATTAITRVNGVIDALVAAGIMSAT